MIISSAYILAAGKSKRIVPPIDVGGVYLRYAYAGFPDQFQSPYGTGWANNWGASSPSATRANEYFIDEYWGRINSETPESPNVPRFLRGPQNVACMADKSWTTTVGTTTPWPEQSLIQKVSASNNLVSFEVILNKEPEEFDGITGTPYNNNMVLSLGIPNGKSGKFKLIRRTEVTLAANIWTDPYNWYSGSNVPIVDMNGVGTGDGDGCNAVFYDGTFWGYRGFGMSATWGGDYSKQSSYPTLFKIEETENADLTGNYSSIQTYDPTTGRYNIGCRDAGGGKYVYFREESSTNEWFVSPSFSAGAIGYTSAQRKDLTYGDAVLNIYTYINPLYFGGIGIGSISGRLYDLHEGDTLLKVTIKIEPVLT